jgi:hypothetical protein
LRLRLQANGEPAVLRWRPQGGLTRRSPAGRRAGGDLPASTAGRQIPIFCHLPPALRADVHRRCVAGLRSGGVMLVEAYTPRQVERGTGGPPTADLMMDVEALCTELVGLGFLHLEECERELHEGAFHDGPGVVVQVVARKP